MCVKYTALYLSCHDLSEINKLNRKAYSVPPISLIAIKIKCCKLKKVNKNNFNSTCKILLWIAKLKLIKRFIWRCDIVHSVTKQIFKYNDDEN